MDEQQLRDIELLVARIPQMSPPAGLMAYQFDVRPQIADLIAEVRRLQDILASTLAVSGLQIISVTPRQEADHGSSSRS